MKPRNKKILKIILTVVACFLAVYISLSAYGSTRAMEIPRLPLTFSAGSLGLAYEDAVFKSRVDGIALKGWYLPGTNSQAIVIVHGGFQNRIDDTVDTSGLVRALVNRGYNVLTFDMRGRGESEGEGRTLSNIDEDIGGAVDYLKNRGFGIDNICLMGFCSGATNISIYGSRNEVGSLILDGCFIDCGTMVVRQGQYINVPGWLTRFFIPGGTFFSWAFYGYHRIDSIDVIPDITCPVFFIHEQYDEFTTQAETQRMFKASANPANEIWEVTGSEHSRGFRIHGEEYIDKIDSFLKKIR